ncbi:MAG: hypothetical protein R2834_03895 [Rhodothermales bacterium]
MKRLFSGLLILALVAAAGCAGSKNAAKQPHPLAGDWSYQIDSPEGAYTGSIMVSENTGGGIDGTLTSDVIPGEMTMTNLMFDQNRFTFRFDSGQYGIVGVNVLVTGDAFNGMVNVDGVGEMPIRGQRK